MRSLIRALAGAAILAAGATAGPTFSYHIVGEHSGPWPDILSSIGLVSSPTGLSSVFVVRGISALSAAQWLSRVEQGAFVIVEGDSALASTLGFRATARRAAVRGIEDAHAPKLSIVWEHPLELPVYEIPQNARVFTKERWSGAPLAAGFRKGSGGVLWIAVSPGERGHERFPYLAQALADLGFEAPFRSGRLWAFFDSSYRSRVDLDYFAERWRKAGIAALHVAAWHYYDADPERDAYLRRLIEACHKRAILVYAWLELPHVSDKFWNDHPEWREKTALLQDAQLDWRKLMNLSNPAASKAIAEGIRSLIGRFDWDGVNLAELYFESLEGYLNPARFTPMNDDVRREFRSSHGFDPIELFDPASPRSAAKDASGMREFLEFRAALAQRYQERWIGELDALRRSQRRLDLVLTHVDDRFDARIRDLIGADASRILPAAVSRNLTFLIEDPATIWNLGPQRYARIAKAYESLTPARQRLAIDINIVERYQDVYPTKQQTGIELFELVHLSSLAFPRVALYFENSILPVDRPLLASAASAVTRVEQLGPKLLVDSKYGVGVPWSGPAMVDGKPWPVRDDAVVWLPAGAHSIEAGFHDAGARILDFNGELKAASATASGVEIAYQSNSRALAYMSKRPARLEIDGAPANILMFGNTLALPNGQHLARIDF
ncbi:MAG TPA: hypothetical protein VFA28_10170 [Bryobacteraceae bacterium]|jgi:hypothetical protein|nr:hypothetical protein [Bryobacteraceae bacterium]